MNIKEKIITNILLAMLGLCLIVGGTSAYFNDLREAKSGFEIGLMELGINKESIIQIDNFVPGDTVNGDFKLTNDGTVDMKKVTLHTSYKVLDKQKNNNGDDLGNHIMVKLSRLINDQEELVFNHTLSELENLPIEVLNEFPTRDKAEFTISFSFIDNGENQNHFQEDSIEMNWEFESTQ